MKSEKPASCDFEINGPERTGDLFLLNVAVTATGNCCVTEEWSNDWGDKFADAICS